MLKKLLSLILILSAISMLLIGCNTSNTTQNNITMTTEKSTYSTDVEKIVCKLTNNTEEKLTYGQDYKLFKSENGNFTEVSPKNDGVEDIAYILEPNETDDVTYNVAYKYGNLEAGEYKISINVEKNEVTCQFTIK